MIKTFHEQGDFAAKSAAKQWLHENGYSVGIMRGDALIAKWRNLTLREKAALDGQMTGDMRAGPVTIEIFHLGAE